MSFKISILQGILFWSFYLVASYHSPAAQARIAVVTKNSAVGVSADALSAELSKIPDIILVERDQLAKVVQEQELSAMQRADIVKMGRLLNAEGIVLMDRLTRVKDEKMIVRLIAVKPGIALAEYQFELPLANP